jgi:hypothetical protein
MSFYAEIVHNRRSTLDVDKLDYYMRDALSCFGKHLAEVRPRRLFASTAVVPMTSSGTATPIPVATLVYEEKLAMTLRDLCALRARLHRTVYLHPTVIRIGHMLGDALAAAAIAPEWRFNGTHTLAAVVNDLCITEEMGEVSEQEAQKRHAKRDTAVEHFIGVGDWLLDSAAACGLDALAPTRELMRRVQTRSGLYPVAFTAPIAQAATKTDVRELSALIRHEVAATVGAARIAGAECPAAIVDVIDVHHGAGDADPLRRVRFYNPKAGAGVTAAADEERIFVPDVLTPSTFRDRDLIVLARDPQQRDAIRRVVASICGAASGDGTLTARVLGAASGARTKMPSANIR